MLSPEILNFIWRTFYLSSNIFRVKLTNEQQWAKLGTDRLVICDNNNVEKYYLRHIISHWSLELLVLFVDSLQDPDLWLSSHVYGLSPLSKLIPSTDTEIKTIHGQECEYPKECWKNGRKYMFYSK